VGSRFRQGDYGRLRLAGLWATDDPYVLYIAASTYVDETNEAKPCRGLGCCRIGQNHRQD
jgi:hypothetical protein